MGLWSLLFGTPKDENKINTNIKKLPSGFSYPEGHCEMILGVTEEQVAWEYNAYNTIKWDLFNKERWTGDFCYTIDNIRAHIEKVRHCTIIEALPNELQNIVLGFLLDNKECGVYQHVYYNYTNGEKTKQRYFTNISDKEQFTRKFLVKKANEIILSNGTKIHATFDGLEYKGNDIYGAPHVSGIYMIKNNITNKAYIGQSTDIGTRWKSHKAYASKGKNALYTAMQKDGIDNFTFYILEECSPMELDIKEVEYIQKYNTFYDGYNTTRGNIKKVEQIKAWQTAHTAI